MGPKNCSPQTPGPPTFLKATGRRSHRLTPVVTAVLAEQGEETCVLGQPWWNFVPPPAQRILILRCPKPRKTPFERPPRGESGEEKRRQAHGHAGTERAPGGPIATRYRSPMVARPRQPCRSKADHRARQVNLEYCQHPAPNRGRLGRALVLTKARWSVKTRRRMGHDSEARSDLCGFTIVPTTQRTAARIRYRRVQKERPRGCGHLDTVAIPATAGSLYPESTSRSGGPKR